MRKYFIVATAFLLIALTACGKYTVDNGMPEKLRQEHETLLADMLEKLKTAPTEEEKNKYTFEVGFQYQALGRYGKAIPYYKDLLAKDKLHYTALNNLASIYEEVGEFEKAEFYLDTLAKSYTAQSEPTRDYIRLLLKLGKVDESRVWLEAFISGYPAESKGDPAFLKFVSEMYQAIFEQDQKNKKEPKTA